MKTTRRWISLLLAMTMLAATPLTAMAAYVPVKGVYYYKDGSSWEKSGEFSASYKSDGRLTSRTSLYNDGYKYTNKYTWKGNFITKISYSNGATSYKYKGKKRLSYTTSGETKTTYKYKWKKNTATMTVGDTTVTMKFNSKGQLVQETDKFPGGSTSVSVKYYSNGNVKSVTYKGSTYSETMKYNSNGYITSEKGKDSGGTWSYTYKYKTKKGKIVQRTSKYSYNGDSGESRTDYTKWKKVSRSRNCDAFGMRFSLG